MILESFASASARRGFALGLGCGLLLACVGFVVNDHFATRAPGPVDAGDWQAATGEDWRHPTPLGGLAAAVELSASILPTMRPVATGPLAVSTGEAPQQMLARAEQHRRNREFTQACASYEAVAQRGGMTADAWADYADARASLDGRLAGAPARAIEAALALEPDHAKALWLQASLAHEEHRYAAALATWRRLLALVPPGSTDARIIEANIVEATRLAAG